ncbi:MAG: peptide deformylase [Rhizobiaceae bacterium]
MAVRPIVKYPDPRLRQVAEPVALFDDALRTLVDDIYDTMRAAPGIGITGPHLGMLKRIVVIQLAATEPRRAYINPVVVSFSSDTKRHLEGSVSMPGVSDEIERPASVQVRYQDIDGAEHVEDADGLLAVCLQHEIDQLDGIFWLQRLSPLRRERVVKRYQKMQKH